MDSENMDSTSVAETPWWNRVTPLSKYLTLALLVVLPFVGFSLGYWYASPLSISEEGALPLEVESSQTTESVQTFSVSRPIFSRSALEARELELMERFGISKEDRPRLYRAEDENSPYMLVPYYADGLSMQVPYNAGWGAPYYQLTPYDRTEEFGVGTIVFGTLNPCPEGCLESGGVAHNNVILFPAGSLASLTASFAEGECKEKSINDHISGIECAERSHMGDYGFFLEGSQYTYKFTGCPGAREPWCSAFYESIRVE